MLAMKYQKEIQRNSFCLTQYIMKKIIAMSVLAGMILSSCSQQANCPAYGTTRADAPKVKRA